MRRLRSNTARTFRLRLGGIVLAALLFLAVVGAGFLGVGTAKASTIPGSTTIPSTSSTGTAVPAIEYTILVGVVTVLTSIVPTK